MQDGYEHFTGAWLCRMAGGWVPQVTGVRPNRKSELFSSRGVCYPLKAIYICKIIWHISLVNALNCGNIFHLETSKYFIEPIYIFPPSHSQKDVFRQG